MNVADDQALDRLIDALNAGELDRDGAAIADPELAELLALARDLRRLRRLEMPDEDFPKRLAGRLAAALQPSSQPLPDSGEELPRPPSLNGHSPLNDRLVIMARDHSDHGWLREGLRMAAAVLALALLTGLLVTLLRGWDGQPVRQIGAPAPTVGQSAAIPPVARNHLLGTPGTPGRGTPSAGNLSIWDFDQNATRAYESGLGQRLQLTQQANGFSVTFKWAYADGQHLYLYFQIRGPAEQTFNNINVLQLDVRDNAGLTAGTGQGVGSGMSDGLEEMLFRFDAVKTSKPTGSLALHVTIPALQAIVPNPAATPTPAPAPAASSGTPASEIVEAQTVGIPKGADGLPDSACNLGDPVCFITVRGPFSFDFSVPVQPSGIAQPQATPEQSNAAAPTPMIVATP